MSSFSNSYGSTRRSPAALVLQILFDEFRRVHAHGGQMADLLGAGSNQLIDMLKDWNNVLQHSSLGKKPANTDERQDGDAPRASRPAVVRRRKLA